MHLCYLCANVECWRFFKVLLHFAQLSGTDKRVMIFRWEGRWNEDVDVDLLDHAACHVGVDALHDLDALRR